MWCTRLKERQGLSQSAPDIFLPRLVMRGPAKSCDWLKNLPNLVAKVSVFVFRTTRLGYCLARGFLHMLLGSLRLFLYAYVCFFSMHFLETKLFGASVLVFLYFGSFYII